MKKGKKKRAPAKIAQREKSLPELTRLAMLQAAKRAREENKRFGEPLIVWENNKIKKIPAVKL